MKTPRLRRTQRRPPPKSPGTNCGGHRQAFRKRRGGLRPISQTFAIRRTRALGDDAAGLYNYPGAIRFFRVRDSIFRLRPPPPRISASRGRGIKTAAARILHFDAGRSIDARAFKIPAPDIRTPPGTFERAGGRIPREIKMPPVCGQITPMQPHFSTKRASSANIWKPTAPRFPNGAESIGKRFPDSRIPSPFVNGGNRPPLQPRADAHRAAWAAAADTETIFKNKRIFIPPG